MCTRRARERASFVPSNWYDSYECMISYTLFNLSGILFIITLWSPRVGRPEGGRMDGWLTTERTAATARANRERRRPSGVGAPIDSIVDGRARGIGRRSRRASPNSDRNLGLGLEIGARRDRRRPTRRDATRNGCVRVEKRRRRRGRRFRTATTRERNADEGGDG